MIDLKAKKQILVDEFNKLSMRQKEIAGALQMLEEIEKEEKPKEEEEKK